jgi:flagellar assembly factor FliW
MTTADLDVPALVETRFGAFAASPRDVIHVAGGLPGFETCTRYVLVEAHALSPFKCLQGLDGPKPSFLVIDPSLVQPGFSIALSGTELRRLGAEPGDPLAWLAIVRVGPGERATVNLRAPLAVNPGRMLGLQALPPESCHHHDHPLRLEPQRAGVHA